MKKLSCGSRNCIHFRNSTSIFLVLILKVPSNDFEGIGKEYKTSSFPTKRVDLKGRKVKKGVVAREITVLLTRPAFYGGPRDLMTPNYAVMLGSEKNACF